MTFDGKYQDWNQKRIKGILEFYGHKFLYYKKILDLGCGHADISGVFYRLGADITAVDARQEHLKIIGKKYNGIKTVKADLDNEWPFVRNHFDIALDLDLLCHLSNYEDHLKKVCSITNHLILETAVCDSDDSNKNVPFPENKNIYDLSFNGMGCLPSTAAIERVLSDCGMEFRRQDVSKYNSGSYQYDWQPKNDNSIDLNKRRLWFAIKRGNPIQFAIPPAPVKPIMISSPVQPTQAGAIRNSMLPIRSRIEMPEIQLAQLNIPEKTGIKNTRIAICISGNLRTFDRTYNSFYANLLYPYQNDADVFIHTWDTIGAKSLSYDHPLSFVETKNKMNEINSILKPKSIIIENYATTSPSIRMMTDKIKLSESDRDGLRNRSPFDYGCMLYSWNKTKQLVDEYENNNNIKYDLIVKLRSDLMFTGKFNIENAFDKLCVPNIGQYYFHAMNDQFALGPASSMKTYLSLYENMVNYFHGRVTSMLRPEFILKYHLAANKIPYYEMNIPYYILRPNNNVTHPTTVKQS
jgi:SAM-dependent methyltransferase